MRVSFDATEIITYYKLFKIGLSWNDIENMPNDIAEKLLMLQNVIDEKEEKEMKKNGRA